MVMQIPSWLIYSMAFIGLFMAFFSLLIFIQSKKAFYIEREMKEIKKLLPADLPKVTFLIPTYNEEGMLPKAIKSIFSLKYPKNKIKILVVDDGSTDNSPLILRKLAEKYKNIKIARKENEGLKSIAVNYGIKRIDTELTVILDADTIVKKNSLIKAVAFLKGKTIAVSLGLMPLQKHGFFARMQHIEYAMTRLFKKLLSNIKATPQTPDYTVFRTWWLKENNFDENNLTEDFEMSLRLQSKGYDVAYVFETGALTEVPTKLKEWHKQRIRWNYGGIYNFIKYKELFKRKDNLGKYTLPTMVFGMILGSLAFFLGIYALIFGTTQYIQALSVGWTPSFSFTSDQLIFVLSDLKIIIGLIGLFLSFVYFIFIKKAEKTLRVVDYIVFLAVYMWFIAYSYVAGIIQYLIKKPSW